MFGTRRSFQIENLEIKDESGSEELTYGVIALTQKIPFLLATVAQFNDAKEISFVTYFTPNFEYVSNVLCFNKGYRLDALQLIRPNDEYGRGWEQHQIILIRTIDGVEDEYITSEGLSIIFKSKTLEEIEGSKNQVVTLYSEYEKKTKFPLNYF